MAIAILPIASYIAKLSLSYVISEIFPKMTPKAGKSPSIIVIIAYLLIINIMSKRILIINKLVYVAFIDDIWRINYKIMTKNA